MPCLKVNDQIAPFCILEFELSVEAAVQQLGSMILLIQPDDLINPSTCHYRPVIELMGHNFMP